MHQALHQRMFRSQAPPLNLGPTPCVGVTTYTCQWIGWSDLITSNTGECCLCSRVCAAELRGGQCYHHVCVRTQLSWNYTHRPLSPHHLLSQDKTWVTCHLSILTKSTVYSNCVWWNFIPGNLQHGRAVFASYNWIQGVLRECVQCSKGSQYFC